jgi:hypothetical protein
MAVLIGVLAPTYLKYVESSKKTADCTSIGAMMDAIEVAAIDATAKMSSGDSITISIDVDELTAKYSSTNATALAAVKEIAGDADLQTKWHTADFTIVGTKNASGSVVFTCTQKSVFQTTSEALYSRFE